MDVIIMQLKPDCVRDVLLYLEENLLVYGGEQNRVMRNTIGWKQVYEDEMLNKSYLIEDIQYTILQLSEAGMIRIKLMSGGQNRGIVGVDIEDITWCGHELLANLQGDQLWDTTKSIAKSLGTLSVKALSTIATSVVNAKISQYFQTGIV